MKKIFNAKNITGFVFFSFIITAVYTSVMIYLAPVVAPYSDITVRVKSDFAFLLLLCILGIITMLLPYFLNKRVSLKIPSIMVIVYALFLFCGIFLGGIRNFYYRVPHFDTLLHIFSGISLGALGFSLISLLNKAESIEFKLSPGFVALFAFCFAVTLGVAWEIFEFAVDYFLRTNMQKYASTPGEPLIGQAALTDTMKDLIVDGIGAFGISLIGYISLKHKKGWLDRFKIKRS